MSEETLKCTGCQKEIAVRREPFHIIDRKWVYCDECFWPIHQIHTQNWSPLVEEDGDVEQAYQEIRERALGEAGTEP